MKDDEDLEEQHTEGASGEFGFERSDPIPVDGVLGEHYYLSKLRCPDGEPFFFHRKGSCGSGPDGHVIDMFELICKKEKHDYTVYIDMYHQSNSDRSPSDLSISEPKGVGVTDFVDDFEEMTFEDMEEIDEFAGQDWRLEGEKYLSSGEYERALECFDRAKDLEPFDERIWTDKGKALSRLNRFEEAIDSYHMALDIDKELTEAWNGYGKALYELGEFEKALEYFDTAIKLEPESVDPWFNKVLTLRKMGEKKRALDIIQEIPADGDNEEYIEKALEFVKTIDDDFEMVMTLSDILDERIKHGDHLREENLNELLDKMVELCCEFNDYEQKPISIESIDGLLIELGRYDKAEDLAEKLPDDRKKEVLDKIDEKREGFDRVIKNLLGESVDEETIDKEVPEEEIHVSEGRPTTLEEALDRVIESLSVEDMKHIRSLIDEDRTSQLHHTLGTWIRNEFGLWSGNDSLKRSIEERTGYSPGDSDEYSKAILDEVCDRLAGMDESRLEEMEERIESKRKALEEEIDILRKELRKDHSVEEMDSFRQISEIMETAEEASKEERDD